MANGCSIPNASSSSWDSPSSQTDPPPERARLAAVPDVPLADMLETLGYDVRDEVETTAHEATGQLAARSVSCFRPLLTKTCPVQRHIAWGVGDLCPSLPLETDGSPAPNPQEWSSSLPSPLLPSAGGCASASPVRPGGIPLRGTGAPLRPSSGPKKSPLIRVKSSQGPGRSEEHTSEL